MKPLIAIVGRPNVGKSSLLNALAKQRISIVDDTPGITRDRVSVSIEFGDKVCEVVDTGGIGVVDVDELSDMISGQIETAFQNADLILFVVDAIEGIRALDKRISDKVRKINKPLILVVNKCDNPKIEAEATEFYEFGFENIELISVIGRRNIGDLRDKIEKHINRLPREKFTQNVNETQTMKIAFVGRRNTGKSSFVNALARQDRVIVSEIEGTTRDAVDVEFLFKGKKFIAIDTAGVRRKRSVENTFEYYSQSRAYKSIRRADVIVLMLDAQEDIADLDKKLASRAVELIKPVIICVNKWDLAEDEELSVKEYEKYIRAKLPGLNFAPISFTSVLEELNLGETIDLAQELWEQTLQRINTGELNRIITAALERKKPPRLGTRRAKIYYSTQVDVNPPTVVLFVNDPVLFPKDYNRYLVNQLRESSVFPEIPIKIIFKAKTDENSNN